MNTEKHIQEAHLQGIIDKERSKRKVVVSIVLVFAAILSVMFFVYGLTQDLQAQKFEEISHQLEKEKLGLLDQNRQLVQKLEMTMAEVQLARKTAQENLEACAKLKKK